MNWEQLLSLKRHGDTHKRLRKEQDETRLGFEVDYDRVIFSSAFRSLQDKTQVVPLSKTDFVHTRLTHSLEVSVVGRSLGRKVGTKLLEKYPHLKEVHGFQFNDFGAIVAAAALAHDIGNPPFGHSGEKAIGEYFKIRKGTQFQSKLTPKEFQDLCDFEGNANGFKLLTEDRKGVDGSLRLSYATLGAFMKYPKQSLPKKPTSHIADKKYGIFQSQKEAFTDVANELGLKQYGEGDDIRYARYPLTFLVEAADDICYTIIDFEDGINLGLIQEERALEFLINLVKDNINREKYASLQYREDRLSYLRALSINTLIQDAARVFLENEEAIRAGEFSVGLMEKSKYKAQIDDIIKISVDKIYKSSEVIEKEITGYHVLQHLLDTFITAVENHHNGSISNYDRLILKVLPENVDYETNHLYNRLMNITNYISRLSDSKAVILFNKLTAKTV